MAFTYIDQVHILPLSLALYIPSHSPKLSSALFIFLHDAPSPFTLFLSHLFYHWLQCCLFAFPCADPWVLTLLADLYCCGLASFSYHLLFLYSFVSYVESLSTT